MINPHLTYLLICLIFAGKVTVYLGKRDFIDHLDHVEPIEGVVVVDNDYLRGRKIFGQLSTVYRYGREQVRNLKIICFSLILHLRI